MLVGSQSASQRVLDGTLRLFESLVRFVGGLDDEVTFGLLRCHWSSSPRAQHCDTDGSSDLSMQELCDKTGTVKDLSCNLVSHDNGGKWEALPSVFCVTEVSCQPVAFLKRLATATHHNDSPA